MNCPEFSNVALFLDLNILTNITADDTPFAQAGGNSSQIILIYLILTHVKLSVTVENLNPIMYLFQG